jgi:hypothetical protein
MRWAARSIASFPSRSASRRQWEPCQSLRGTAPGASRWKRRRGLAAWFTLHLADGIDLGTGRGSLTLEAAILPLALAAGTHAIEAGPAPEDSRTLLVSIGDREVRIR